MKVFSKAKKITLAENIVDPKTLLDQSVGLLKYKTPTAMLLKTRFGIHTFGMKYPIDVLILDKQNCVAVLKENLRPNLVFLWNLKYKIVLELPPGTIKKAQIKLKDQLTFIS